MRTGTTYFFAVAHQESQVTFVCTGEGGKVKAEDVGRYDDCKSCAQGQNDRFWGPVGDIEIDCDEA